MSFSKFLCVAFLFFAACGETASTQPDARILLLGDSLMAVNGGGVANGLEQELGEEVIDRSVSGARYVHGPLTLGDGGLSITGQFATGEWDWVVLNGYGNNLLWGCGCHFCDDEMDALISADGTTGTIPQFVTYLRSTGAKVAYTGYLRTNGFQAPVESCGVKGDEMDRRLALMAEADDGIFFVNIANVVPDGDRSFHAFDRVHPSNKGSAAIAARIATVIRDN